MSENQAASEAAVRVDAALYETERTNGPTLAKNSAMLRLQPNNAVASGSISNRFQISLQESLGQFYSNNNDTDDNLEVEIEMKAKMPNETRAKTEAGQRSNRPSIEPREAGGSIL